MKNNGLFMVVCFFFTSLIGCTATVADTDEGGAGGGGDADDCDIDHDGHSVSGCDDDSSRPDDDCDDFNNRRFPGAPEICNGIDDDCDGSVDEGEVCGGNPPPTDSDSDGDPDTADCALQDSSRHHGAPEICNDLDDDCDGSVDEGDVCGGNPPPTDSDSDGDPNSTDCAPQDSSRHHGAPEVCNNLDDDCDGSVDEGGVCGGGQTMCTVAVKWTVTELIPTGSAYVFGGYNPPSSGYVDHWSNPGACVPNGNGPLCALVKNGNVYTCSFEIESKTPLVFVIGAGQTNSQTGCMWSFDEGCWDGGGCAADNGLTQVYVEGVEQSLMQVSNPDAFPETSNGRVWVDCG